MSRTSSLHDHLSSQKAASSDLYVVGDVPGAKDTGKTGQVNYAIGSTNGTSGRALYCRDTGVSDGRKVEAYTPPVDTFCLVSPRKQTRAFLKLLWMAS